MSNREALRELQTRLAQRLQGAGHDAQAASWLAVECEGQGIVLPLASAGEIFAMAPLTPLPHTRPWFLGVVNLRGQLHGVVDLAAFLHLRPALSAEQLAEPQRQASARLLAFHPALGSHCAVLVDKLAGLRGPQQLQQLQPVLPPDTQSRSADFTPAGNGAAAADAQGSETALWRDEQGRDWRALDLGQLAASEHFLAIAA